MGLEGGGVDARLRTSAEGGGVDLPAGSSSGLRAVPVEGLDLLGLVFAGAGLLTAAEGGRSFFPKATERSILPRDLAGEVEVLGLSAVAIKSSPWPPGGNDSASGKAKVGEEPLGDGGVGEFADGLS
mmetsp:Transcript_7533/g.13348  ORF Transcript_7533/g.13348 Transcript_7533/m.13348 type:complete len:127 (-) Transcript_7533:653-1033(-)